MHCRWLPALILLMLCCPVRGQVTQPALRREVVIPAGYEVIEREGRRVIATMADAEWVRQALVGIQPATRPSTLPADVIERLIAKRAWLEQQLARDLLIEDPAVIRDFIDQRLLPRVRAVESAPIPLFYLAISRPALKELMKQGWSDPRFYYNRAADEIMIQPRLEVNFDRPMDDLLVGAFFEPGDTVEIKQAALADTIQSIEAGLAQELSIQAQRRLQMELLAFIEQHLIDRIDWKADQVWLRLGLVAVLSARYAAEMTGADSLWYVAPMVAEPPRVRLRAANIDLLHPADPQDLRREYVSAYFDAMRRKSVAVVWDWLREAKSEQPVPDTLKAVLERKPVDGQELIKLIHATTDVDLTARLLPP